MGFIRETYVSFFETLNRTIPLKVEDPRLDRAEGMVNTRGFSEIRNQKSEIERVEAVLL